MRFLRLGLSVIAALFFFVAGAQMREQGSGIDLSFGLLAYGAAFAILSYGTGGLRDATPTSPAPSPRARSFYDDEA